MKLVRVHIISNIHLRVVTKGILEPSQLESSAGVISKVTALHKQLGTYTKLGVRVGSIEYKCFRNRNQMTHETALICYGTDINGGQVVMKGFQQELKVLGHLNKKKWLPFVKAVSCLQAEKDVHSTAPATPNSSNSTYDSSESHRKVAKYYGIGKTFEGKMLQILCFQV